MRSLVLVGPYPPPWGGIAVHLRALQRLAQERGIPVRIFDTGEGHRGRDGSNEVYRGGGAYGVASAVRGSFGHPIHAHISGNNTKAWLVALSLGRPFGREGAGAILTVHSGLVPGFLRERAHRELARAASIGFRHVLCTNEAIASALHGAGVAASRLEVLSPFLPDPDPPPEPPLEVRTLRDRARPLIAAAVAEGRQYGLEILLEAVPMLARKIPGMGLLIFGPGAERIRPERLEPLQGRALVFGAVDHRVARACIGAADLFLRPTLADGDSVSVREALGLGVRVVASDVGKRPPEATLFRAGDPAEMVRAIDASLSLPAPSRGAGWEDASRRLLAAWEGIGIPIGGKSA